MRRGFTLIELLVVIAIIAILAAILFPVFAKAREKARQASCQSNLKQIALAFIMYMQDYDGRWPRWEWGVVGGGGTPTPDAQQWYVRLYPYVKNVQLFQCPSRSDNGGCRWCFANPDDSRYVSGYPPFRAIHYGYNEPMSNNCCGRGQESDMKYPAEVLMVGDCFASLGGWEAHPEHILYRYACAGTGRPCIGCGNPLPSNAEDYAVHNGGSNIAYADGHVKWMRWMNFKTIEHGGSIRYRAWQW